MALNPNDFVLLASFLAQEQKQKQNNTIRLLNDIVQGKTDRSLLTKDLEYSLHELKEQQLTEIKLLWSQTSYPTQTIAHMVKVHNSFMEDSIDIETKRLVEAAEVVRSEKLRSATPEKVSAESLGLSMTRRPVKKLPPTHVTTETGATFGIDPQSGKTRMYPLLYNSLITDLKTISDVLVCLPNSKKVDFRPSLENIIKRGQILGFGERHFHSIFKLFISKHFEQYNTVLTGVTAEEIFDNLLIVFRSHDIATSLKDSLKRFSRLPEQSFTEFSTVLESLAIRTVQETHLQMSLSEASEFAQDKLLDHLTCFTSRDVKKLFESQRASALRSNSDFYSFNGAVLTIYKIEQFVKAVPSSYSIPSELYITLTSDSSLNSTVMLQAIQLAAKTQPPPEQISQIDSSVFQSSTRPRSKSPFRNSPPYVPRQNNYQTTKPIPHSPFRSPHRAPSRQSRSPGRNESHRPNPAHVSPQRPNFQRQGRSQSTSRQQGQPSQPPRQSSTERGAQSNQRHTSRSPSQYAQGPSQRQRSHSRENPRQPRSSSRERTGQYTTRQSRDEQQNPASPTGQGGAPDQRRGQSAQRSSSRDRYKQRQPSRSPSAGRKSYCPFCGKGTCAPGECKLFWKSNLSNYPCNLCPRELYHKTSAHYLMNKN